MIKRLSESNSQPYFSFHLSYFWLILARECASIVLPPKTGRITNQSSRTLGSLFEVATYYLRSMPKFQVNLLFTSSITLSVTCFLDIPTSPAQANISSLVSMKMIFFPRFFLTLITSFCHFMLVNPYYLDLARFFNMVRSTIIARCTSIGSCLSMLATTGSNRPILLPATVSASADD